MRKEKPSYTCMDSAREAGGSPSASEGLALPPLMHRPHPMPLLANSLRHRPQPPARKIEINRDLGLHYFECSKQTGGSKVN